jgi:hypothetical protein
MHYEDLPLARVSAPLSCVVVFSSVVLGIPTKILVQDRIETSHN